MLYERIVHHRIILHTTYYILHTTYYILILHTTYMRKPECDEVGSEVNTRAALEDVGHNADLYIAIQEDNMQN